jgi:hypothetical protein
MIKTAIVDEIICMKLMTDGDGKYSIATLFASKRVDEQSEYAIIANTTYNSK